MILSFDRGCSIASVIVIACTLGACSETVIGREPTNLRPAATAEASAGDHAFDSGNWMRDVPRCRRNFGTVALLEQDVDISGPGAPQNASPMLRYLLQKSGCFTVVERGAGLAKMEGERAFAQSQVATYRRMDYLLTARVIFQESRSNDAMLGASRSHQDHLTSSAFGLNFTFTDRVVEVNSVLLLTDARSSVQVIAEQGTASKSDRSINSFSSFGFDSLSGKTMAASLFDAFARMVRQLNDSNLKPR